ncbi:MAG: hypothetical protein HFF11_10165 [Angelakisella sp.]|jgi:hypothetical protein|nr:hypothetical protein [Angelakisella sp.]
MPPYLWYLLTGLVLAVFSEKIDQLMGGQRWVRRMLSALAPLLVMIGFAQAALAALFR